MAESLPALSSRPIKATRQVSSSGVANRLVLAALVILIAVLFAPLLVPVELAWRRDQNYSHGYLIPLICLALAMRSWGRAGPPVHGERRMAFMTLIPGAVLLLA